MALAFDNESRFFGISRLNGGTVVDLEALSDFVLVAANGGIAQASRAGRRPKASLSRKVAELEASLGVRLFERGSRSVHLTKEGETLYARTAGPLGEISEIAELLREGRARPRGRLRINVPTMFGQLLMGRLAAEFTIAYPDITLDVTMDDREVDPVTEGFDVVVRVNPKPDSSLVGRCFARDRVLVVAAPSLAAPSLAAPSTSSDPGNKKFLPTVVRNAIDEPAVWRVGEPANLEIAVRPALELPSLAMIRDAVVTGIGAAKLPEVLVRTDLATGRLVSWGTASDHPSELWALHASTRLISAKVKAFIRFLDAQFANAAL